MDSPLLTRTANALFCVTFTVFSSFLLHTFVKLPVCIPKLLIFFNKLPVYIVSQVPSILLLLVPGPVGPAGMAQWPECCPRGGSYTHGQAKAVIGTVFVGCVLSEIFCANLRK